MPRLSTAPLSMSLSLTLAAALTLAALSARPAAAEEKPKAQASYLVIAPHTGEQCLAVLDDIKEHDAKLLEKMEWGCMAGDHTGYLTTQAATPEAALGKLPEKSRAGARAVKLNKFSSAQIATFHKK